jgi:osmotically-inducible protein OsmY
VIDDVCQALERDPYIDASEIEVSCQKGEIVLGQRRVRDAKRRANTASRTFRA